MCSRSSSSLVGILAFPPIGSSDPTESIAVEMITTEPTRPDHEWREDGQAACRSPSAASTSSPISRITNPPRIRSPEAKKDTPPPAGAGKGQRRFGRGRRSRRTTGRRACRPRRPHGPRRSAPSSRPPTPVTPPTPPERPIEKVEQSKPDAAGSKPEAAKEPPPPPDAEALAPKPPPRPKVEPKVSEDQEAGGETRPASPVKEAQGRKARAAPEAGTAEEARDRPKSSRQSGRIQPKHDTKQTLDQVAKLLDTMKPAETPVVKTRSGNESKEAQAHQRLLARTRSPPCWITRHPSARPRQAALADAARLPRRADGACRRRCRPR